MQVQGVYTINNTSFGYNLPVHYANFGNMQELLENTGKKIFEKNPKEYQEWQQALSELRIKRFDATEIDNRFRPILEKYNYQSRCKNFRALYEWDKYLNSLQTINLSKIDASISDVGSEQSWSIGEPSGSWFSACTYLVIGKEKTYLECYDRDTDVYDFFKKSFCSADNIRKFMNKIDRVINLEFMLKVYSILNSARTMAKLSSHENDVKEIESIINEVDAEIKNRNKTPN